MPAELYSLGYISRAQGLNGGVRLTTEYPEIISELKGKTVYLTKGDKQFSFFIQTLRPHDKDSFALIFKECDNREMAESLIGYTVHIPKADLPVSKGKSFFSYELEGMQVEDKKLGSLGVIEGVFPSPAHPVASLTYQGVEILLPLSLTFISEIDRTGKVLKLDLPEGLLEVYLNPGSEEM
jgi:16S rRNA processing protein RimM